MRFRKDATLDPSQVEDRRGRGRARVPERPRRDRRRRRRPWARCLGDLPVRRPAVPKRRARASAEPRRPLRGDAVAELRARLPVCHRGGGKYPRRLPHRRRRQQRPGLLGGSVPTERPELHDLQDRLLLGRDRHRLRRRDLRRRPVLLPGRQEGLHRPRLLQRPPRSLRGGRRRRSPRHTCSPTSTATTSRTCSETSTGLGGTRARRRAVRPHRAPGRLLRRRLGEPRDADGVHRGAERRRTSLTASMLRRRWATTGSRPGRRARSIPRPGRTAVRASASTGSRWATRAAGLRPVTPLPARSRPDPRPSRGSGRARRRAPRARGSGGSAARLWRPCALRPFRRAYFGRVHESRISRE